MEEIVTPSEAKIETLLRLLAVLLNKLDGEQVISRADFEMLEGVAVNVRNISKDYILLRLAEEDEESGFEIIDLPEENPQT
jgi:hypothetical protein